MKRSLFKQLIVSALFVCSLSADVPDVREQAEDRGRSANQTGTCSFGLCDGHARGMSAWPSTLSAGTMPDPLACVRSVVWPLDGFGIHSMDRACVRWDALPNVSQEAINIPTDPLDAVFLVPRYRMFLSLQESVWQVWEPALALDVEDRSDRVDVAAMIPRLKKIFAQEGVPQQWVWVAEVESALNPRAKSSAGAAGLFQLMPGTARRFGLRTTPLDDRMEPEKSAGAAAQYLKFLRREFGCWSLALAAYNAGEGRVKEIMKKRKASTFNEVERYLPSETRAYVPKVMAIVALREDQLHSVPGAYWMP